MADPSNPLLSDSPRVWEDLIDSVVPASILVVIESRMSAALRHRFTPEDVWQEVLLHAWRDRAACEWRGIKGFRNWLLTIVDHRLADLADRESAQKRGARAEHLPIHGRADGTDGFTPARSTTPSRIALHREQAAAMRAALQSLPDDVRDVVRLRLFEHVPVEAVAATLGLGASAVRHRFRRGAQLYRQRLELELGSGRYRIDPESMPLRLPNPASDA